MKNDNFPVFEFLFFGVRRVNIPPAFKKKSQKYNKNKTNNNNNNKNNK